MGVALLDWVPDPVGHGAPAKPLTITASPPPAGSTIDAYDAAVQHAFAQVQAAVAASADLKAVPSNLEPATCRRGRRVQVRVPQRLPAQCLGSRTARVRDGRYRLDDDGGPAR